MLQHSAAARARRAGVTSPLALPSPALASPLLSVRAGVTTPLALPSSPQRPGEPGSALQSPRPRLPSRNAVRHRRPQAQPGLRAAGRGGSYQAQRDQATKRREKEVPAGLGTASTEYWAPPHARPVPAVLQCRPLCSTVTPDSAEMSPCVSLRMLAQFIVVIEDVFTTTISNVGTIYRR